MNPITTKRRRGSRGTQAGGAEGPEIRETTKSAKIAMLLAGRSRKARKTNRGAEAERRTINGVAAQKLSSPYGKKISIQERI